MRRLCPAAIGVRGFDYRYPRVREIDLSWYEDDPEGEKAITSHAEWGNVAVTPTGSAEIVGNDFPILHDLLQGYDLKLWHIFDQINVGWCLQWARLTPERL